jgi:hypothetical protein
VLDVVDGETAAIVASARWRVSEDSRGGAPAAVDAPEGDATAPGASNRAILTPTVAITAAARRTEREITVNLLACDAGGAGLPT